MPVVEEVPVKTVAGAAVVPAPAILPHIETDALPGIDGISKFLPQRIRDQNRSSAVKVFVYDLNATDTSAPLTAMLVKVQSNLASRGITNLSRLGNYPLGNAQNWRGGQFLTPKPLTSTVVTNINEFWVAADEIDIQRSLNATIRISGTVVLVANKINIEAGAQINWYPPDPFSINQFDWKSATGVPTRAADGANGAAGSGNTWSNSAPPADKMGHPGGNGANGQPGNPGLNAPSIVLVAKEITNLPVINLAGWRGGAGQNGGNGGNGGAGDKGEPAQSSWGFNTRGCGWGGNGGPGGNAGCGGVGGHGGDGGDVVIYTLQATKDALTKQPINISLQPGPGGDGGGAGRPGIGGPGGPHGDRTGAGEIDDTNRNGSTGPAGLSNQTPPAQLRGPDGVYHGSMTFTVVTDAQFDQMAGESAIVKFVPNSGKPGDMITLYAINVPAMTQVAFGATRLSSPVWIKSQDNYTTQFRVPEESPGGLVSVSLVDQKGAAISICPENFLVMPRLDRATGEAVFGGHITLSGAGFASPCRVVLGDQTLNGTYAGTKQVTFVIPTPPGAFEQNACTKTVSLINPGGYTSNQVSLAFDHWLHLGFQPLRDGFQFINNQAVIKAANVSVDLDLFTQTFGSDDRKILVPDDVGSVLGDLADPANTALGWIFFGIYKEFLASAPGICCGMSAYALDHYLSGGPALYSLYPTFTGKIARDITALQGRVLSGQALDAGIAAIVANTASNDRFGGNALFQQLEAAIRRVIQSNTPNNRASFPLVSFVPTYEGITDTIDFFNRIGEDHTILPYAIRYPRANENFLARIYCCNNWHTDQKNCVRITIAKDYSFTTEEYGGAAGSEYDTNASYSPLTNGGAVLYQSSGGWSVAPMPMSIAFYGNVDIPTNIFAYLSPVTVTLDDGVGHAIGKVKGDLYSQTQFIAPSPFVKGLFRLGRVDKLTVTAKGQAAGSYRAGLFSWQRRLSGGVLGVTTAPGQADTLAFDFKSASVGFTPGSNVKAFKMVSAAGTTDGVRSSVLSGMNLKAGETAKVSLPGDQLVTQGPTGSLGSLQVTVDGLNKRRTSQTIDLTKAAGHTLNWADLKK